MDWFAHAWVAWLAVAAVLAGVELMIPGLFLIFIAGAAALTGILALLFPELGIAGELMSFAAWSVVAVAIGRRWYHEYPVDTADPLLNDRTARLIGEVVTVVEAIEAGSGRVRVGDGEWIARGPDTPVGARVRIKGASGTSLDVEPLST
ncbi:NfeD family protein [Sphingomonas sp.]|uniref:NfeD family protein n=1 Tax=Sphingomonas sp. TaxID=28214 RepID=UPI001B0E909F|nr:NfeD family protein [Sphingomonas sp.]MBO9711819.1 NfeD family protein [Sphingomonas sp.]